MDGLKQKKWAHAHSVPHLGFELKIIAPFDSPDGSGSLGAALRLALPRLVQRPRDEVVAAGADELDIREVAGAEA